MKGSLVVSIVTMLSKAPVFNFLIFHCFEKPEPCHVVSYADWYEVSSLNANV